MSRLTSGCGRPRPCKTPRKGWGRQCLLAATEFRSPRFWVARPAFSLSRLVWKGVMLLRRPLRGDGGYGFWKLTQGGNAPPGAPRVPTLGYRTSASQCQTPLGFLVRLRGDGGGGCGLDVNPGWERCRTSVSLPNVGLAMRNPAGVFLGQSPVTRDDLHIVRGVSLASLPLFRVPFSGCWSLVTSAATVNEVFQWQPR